MQRSKRKKADGMKFDLAKPGEEEAIFRLYRRCVASPYCTWSEEYPAWENIQADMALRSLYVARDAQKVQEPATYALPLRGRRHAQTRQLAGMP